MAEARLGDVVLSGNFMTIITEDNQIFVLIAMRNVTALAYLS